MVSMQPACSRRQLLVQQQFSARAHKAATRGALQSVGPSEIPGCFFVSQRPEGSPSCCRQPQQPGSPPTNPNPSAIAAARRRPPAAAMPSLRLFGRTCGHWHLPFLLALRSAMLLCPESPCLLSFLLQLVQLAPGR